MTAHEFIEWLNRMWLSDDEAARRLFISVQDVTRFKYEGATKTIGLACAAIAVGAPVWSSTQKHKTKRKVRKAA